MWKEDEMREFQDPYCYKGTSVLINNLGIRNEKNLSTYERAHVASKLLALNIRPNNGDFSLKHYLGIHKYLFEEEMLILQRVVLILQDFNILNQS